MTFPAPSHSAENETAFAVEYLPGQFDQRADSAAQCVQILTGKERPTVFSAKVIILEGALTADEIAGIKNLRHQRRRFPRSPCSGGL